MATKVEVFSAGCSACKEAVDQIKQAAPTANVIVLDMMDAQIAKRAKDLGIRSVPAVLIDGKVADCCAGRGVDIQILRAAGLR
jgi:glutaredoxin